MLPCIVLEEIFSLLARKQVYKLRLLCLAFYQAAFPLLLRIHSLKQIKYVDYQRFLKKNGKLVGGLIIKHFNDYKALLSSGLSLSTIFPNLRLIQCLPYNPNFPECKAMVEDCLQLKKLRHIGLCNCQQPSLQKIFPLFQKLDSVFVDDIFWRSKDNWELCRGLKKLMVSSIVADDFNQVLSKVPFKVEYITSEGWVLPLNIKAVSHTWVYYRGEYFQVYLRLPHGPGYLKNMQLIGLGDLSSNSFILIQDELVLKKILDTPGFSDHLTAYAYWRYPCYFLEDYVPKFPSLHLNCHYSILQCTYTPYQATSISFGNTSCDSMHLYSLTHERFPNLQNLYISDPIQLEMNSRFTLRVEPVPLAIGFFPCLILFSSRVHQANEFWLNLLEAAPKLQYIHTNYKPRNMLVLKKHRPFLQFMSYQDIFGESGKLLKFIYVMKKETSFILS